MLAIRHLLPAWLCFALAGAIDHPLALVLLLFGNAIAMTGICNAIGFGMEASFVRSIARRGLAYFALLTVYTAFVAGVPRTALQSALAGRFVEFLMSASAAAELKAKEIEVG